MSWWEPWPSLSAPAARGVVVAMWVDGHLLRLGPASEPSGDPLAGEPPGAPLQPALRSALRLLGLAATSAGVDAAALLPCCGLLAPRALGAVAPAALTPGLPSGAGRDRVVGGPHGAREPAGVCAGLCGAGRRGAGGGDAGRRSIHAVDAGGAGGGALLR